MNFTFNEKVNSARREYLYNGLETSISNTIFNNSISKTNVSNGSGSQLAKTIRAPGDYIGGRDYSQYTRLKRASSGNSYSGNK
jgi:hypothetical protein